MSDATLARMEHGKYVGVRGEPRRDGVCVIRKPTLLVRQKALEQTQKVSPQAQKVSLMVALTTAITP